MWGYVPGSLAVLSRGSSHGWHIHDGAMGAVSDGIFMMVRAMGGVSDGIFMMVLCIREVCNRCRQPKPGLNVNPQTMQGNANANVHVDGYVDMLSVLRAILIWKILLL